MANKYKTTRTFQKIALAMKRSKILIVQGGQGSSKTTSILQIFIFLAISKRRDLTLSVIADTMPNLKSNAIRVFEKLLKDMGLYTQFEHNKQDKTYTHKETGNIVEFFSVDTDSSRLGARRSHLYICEASEIKFEAYLSLAGRSGVTLMDYNPKFEFWAHTELKGEKGVEFIVVNFEDNEYLPQNEIDMLLWYKKKAYHNPNIQDLTLLNKAENIKSKFYLNKWKVYGLGLLGVAEGLIFEIYEDYNIIEKLPVGAKYLGAGLDFGFSHVTAITKLYQYEEKIILKECLFRSKMTARQIGEFILLDKELMSRVIACDESRPEIIEELQGLGIPADAAKKGSGSVDFGLDLMHTFDLLVTADSENLIHELSRYAYATDKNGRSLGVPDKSKDVDNAIDAARYGFRYFLSMAAAAVKYCLKRVA
ncbi:phage terminase large subunit [Cellulophaga phage phi46:1]|uniref:terminase large subunit n=1 Tax=Cellulophaga phage phi46:1 TaxID=1327974 RepID=UPI0003516EAD|nr:terminase large subunit [Cellulophaga phage phi46:1]AGO47826.1 phage terminase large subunit [Cellulophaga phage phi46:1]